MNPNEWKKKEGRLWLSNGVWSKPRTVYEYHKPVRGMTLWAHTHTLYDDRDDRDDRWVISEASSGLRITVDPLPTIEEALAGVIVRAEPYTDEYLYETIRKEIAKQVAFQIQSSGSKKS